MALSEQVCRTLRKYHLDNPEAQWPALREHLLERASDIVATGSDWENYGSAGLEYEDDLEDLQRAALEASLTIPQAKALLMTAKLLRAAQDRAMGDLGSTLNVIEQLQPEAEPVVSAKEPDEAPMTFAELAALYMAENAVNVKDVTLRNTRSACGLISETLGPLNIKSHTRTDLLKLRESLSKTRKPASVNQILTRLSAVMDWGVNNGYLEKDYSKKLKLSKGTESAREALSQDQVKALMAHASGMEETSMLRWAVSLGCITGARAGEIRQLRPKDVHKVGDVWVIDINDEGAKDVKNKHSVRLVPLIDGAYGFDLQAFLRFVSTIPEGKTLSGLSFTAFSLLINGAVKEVVGVRGEGDEAMLSFHSLRHSLASLMKRHEVPLTTAQAILGHSSQSITFDHYGGGERTGVERLEAVLKDLFTRA